MLCYELKQVNGVSVLERIIEYDVLEEVAQLHINVANKVIIIVLKNERMSSLYMKVKKNIGCGNTAGNLF